MDRRPDGVSSSWADPKQHRSNSTDLVMSERNQAIYSNHINKLHDNWTLDATQTWIHRVEEVAFNAIVNGELLIINCE